MVLNINFNHLTLLLVFLRVSTLILLTLAKHPKVKEIHLLLILNLRAINHLLLLDPEVKKVE